MAKKTKNKFLDKTAILFLLLLIPLGVGAYILSMGEETDGLKTLDEPPPWELHPLQKVGKSIEVHLHIKSMDEADKLIPVMDKMGVAKCVLLGSSKFTITLKEKHGFTEYDKNNEELLKIVKKYPGRFEAWPTIDPLDDKKLDKLKDYVSRGATGLKLYLGHGFVAKSTGRYFFHTMAMDDPRMLPVYRYCQEYNIPVCLHVNPGPTKPGFAQEFIAVLTKFPDMKIICPHFMLSSIKQTRLREFLDTFPNLYTDIGFGFVDYFKAGLKRMSRNHKKFRRLIEDYPDRVMWATDMVLTPVKFKQPWFVEGRFQAYFDVLAKRQWTSDVIEKGAIFNGLALPNHLLERVLWKNYEDFLAKKPVGTYVTREIEWKNMGAEFMARETGQTFLPPKKKKSKRSKKKSKSRFNKSKK